MRGRGGRAGRHKPVDVAGDPSATLRELSRSARSGTLVTLASQLAKATIQFAGLAVLSRLITPTSFGVLAVIVSIVALGELFRDFGLATAAIQAEELTQAQASNLFWLSVTFGSLLSAGCVAAAPLLADLLNEPVLVDPLRAAALSLLLSGLQAQFQVQLVRSLRFTALALSEVAALLLSFTSAVALALAGGEIWALVTQVLVLNAALLVGRAFLAGWRPGLPAAGVGTRHLFNFGAKLGAAQFLSYAASNADNYAISVRSSAYDLGMYSRAFQLLRLPLNQFLGPLTNVLLPILSRLRADLGSYAAFLLRCQWVLCSAAVLGFALAVPLARDVIGLVLGEQWLPSAPLFQLLAVGGAFQVFSFVSYWIFISLGLTGQLLRYNLVTKTLTVAAIVVASESGVRAVAVTQAACLALSWPVNLWWLRRATELPMATFFRDGLAIQTAGVLAALAAYAVRSTGVAASPLLAVVAGIVAFVVVQALVPRSRRYLLDAVGRLRDRLTSGSAVTRSHRSNGR